MYMWGYTMGIELNATGREAGAGREEEEEVKLNRLRLRLRQQKFAQKGTAHTWRIRNRSHDIPKGAAACVCVCVCV